MAVDTYKKKILIADSSARNRESLAMMLEDEYEILEAADGEECLALLRENPYDLALLLLSVNLPKVDGFSILQSMKETGLDKSVPVMVNAEQTAPAYMQKAYSLGVADYIARPYNAMIVKKRIENVILSFSKEQQMLEIISRQLGEKEKANRDLIATLAHIVEFRNGENGQHIKHIQAITSKLLKEYAPAHPEAGLTAPDISTISLASALHDIGKITIPEAILNKAGKLTDEEFAIMQSHSKEGVGILETISASWDKSLKDTAHDICLWHHERYDGSGYPDHLEGDAIPLSAQAAGLADVYDSLTSARVYKDAMPHEKAVKLITTGKVGSFNPDLIESFKAIAPQLESMKEEESNEALLELKDQLAKVKDGQESDGALLSSVEGLLRQVTEESGLQEDIIEYIVGHHEKMYQDTLTGAYNRRYFEDNLKFTPDTSALVLIDVDNFKHLNSLYGHQAGDRVLKEVGHTLMHCIRQTDKLVRLSGDEFAILFDGMPKDTFQMKLGIIQNNVARISLPDLPDISVSVSMGGAYGPGKPKDLLPQAETNLALAKETGFGQTRI